MALRMEKAIEILFSYPAITLYVIMASQKSPIFTTHLAHLQNRAVGAYYSRQVQIAFLGTAYRMSRLQWWDRISSNLAAKKPYSHKRVYGNLIHNALVDHTSVAILAKQSNYMYKE